MNEYDQAGGPLPLDRYDYDLPPELIAQEPIEPRDASRLLVVSREDRSISDHQFRDLPQFLRPGDLIVLNDTRVLPARLRARRRSGGSVELLLLSRQADGTWTAMARPLRRLHEGEALELLDRSGSPAGEHVTVVGREDDAVLLRVDDETSIECHGRVPLPPYIRSPLEDADRYQTVYAETSGSAAAPTAGLHFTSTLMDRCRESGATFTTITLHVGLDTFQPIKTADAREHRMHSERYHVPAVAASAISTAKRDGRRVIAVGTTSVRTLESTADSVLATNGSGSLSGSTQLYITPGFRFRVVDAMITNFHLPRTTLMLLVSALAGEELIRKAYRHAIDQRYRFYSFGDAMLIV